MEKVILTNSTFFIQLKNYSQKLRIKAIWKSDLSNKIKQRFF